jgi:hypothetical protein
MILPKLGRLLPRLPQALCTNPSLAFHMPNEAKSRSEFWSAKESSQIVHIFFHGVGTLRPRLGASVQSRSHHMDFAVAVAFDFNDCENAL